MFEVIPNWHPIFANLSIALFAVAAALYTLRFVVEGRWASSIVAAARINLWLGAVLAIAAVAAGMRAFTTVEHVPSQQLFMSNHRDWALATTAIWWLIAVWEGLRGWQLRSPSNLLITVTSVGVVCLGITGWKDGELVYRHGIGIQRRTSTAQLDQAVFDAIFTDDICH
jgi:uncharacterized membrane protein